MGVAECACHFSMLIDWGMHLHMLPWRKKDKVMGHYVSKGHFPFKVPQLLDLCLLQEESTNLI